MQNSFHSENRSYAIQTRQMTCVKEGWHQHIEHELILFTKGSGITCIGEYEGKFEAGNVFFLGGNLPHTFKNSINRELNAISIQFRDNCWGNHFLNIPECIEIKQLLELAAYGLQITGNSNQLTTLIKTIEISNGINRMIKLLQCLQIMSTANGYEILSKKKGQERIDMKSIEKVIEYTLARFHENISLSQVATVACMSIPSFCHFFKRCTNKTYIDYLNRVRISYACRQLQETSKSVTDICYESGYNTIVHFHRLFLRFKKSTPLQYRKKHSILIRNDDFVH